MLRQTNIQQCRRINTKFVCQNSPFENILYIMARNHSSSPKRPPKFSSSSAPVKIHKKQPQPPSQSKSAPNSSSLSSPQKLHEKQPQTPNQPSTNVRNFAETAAGVTIGSFLGNIIAASFSGFFGFLQPRQPDEMPEVTPKSSLGQCDKEMKAYLESKERFENSVECEQLWELFKQCESKNK